MPAITFFAIPKPFEDRTATLQRNAISSWMHAVADSELLLCGDESGVREVAATFGGKVVDHVTRNDFGTPLLDSAFSQVSMCARSPHLCYMNADMVLCGDLSAVVKAMPFREFLLVARRGDLPRDFSIDFEQDGWQEQVRTSATLSPVEGDPSAIDIFVFPQNMSFDEMPPFAVGRPGWDNWFIYNALARGVPVVDATEAMGLYHQEHGYDHVREGNGSSWEGPEADTNRALAGGWSKMFTILDATHELVDRTVRIRVSGDALDRRVERLREFRPRLFQLLLLWKLRYLFCRYFPMASCRG